MAPDRPNVLFVLCDQLRAEALGCLGNRQVQTPALDGFADESLLATRAYSPSPVCAPARGSIMTGLYPHEHGIPFNSYRLPTDRDSVADCFNRAGYRTGYVGKWHLDGDTDTHYVPPGPRRQGFDYWEGFNKGHQYSRGHPQFSGPDSVTWREGYQPAVQTEIACEFLDTHRDADPDRPFFLFLSWGPPHGPLDPPREYRDRYDADGLELRPNVPETLDPDRVPHLPDSAEYDRQDLREDLADYYALVTSLDDQFAALDAELERLGLTEDTIVVFTADHGDMLGSQGYFTKGYPFEESIHVPLALRYPGRLPGGRRFESVVSLVDLMPTLLSLCDVPCPDDRHGLDLTPQMLGEAEDVTRPGVYVEGWNPYMDSRTPFDTPWRAVRTRNHLLSVDQELETQCLYDVDDDPYQTENLAGAGDPAEAELREDLFELAHALGDNRFVIRHGRRF